jgi:hypothetical protein
LTKEPSTFKLMDMTQLAQTLRALQQLESEQVISRFAIGGAVASARYIEAITTQDLDVFILLEGGLIVTLEPIYQRLAALGFQPEGEHIRIGAWLVQFIPVASDLQREALTEALEVTFDTVPTRVFTAEHLCALMLATGRAKDHLRLVMFLESKAVSKEALENIVVRHHLEDRWKQFILRHYTP